LPTAVGVLISDGFLKINKQGNTSFYLKQGVRNFKYLCCFALVFMKLSHYCSSYPSINTTKIKGKIYPAIYFRTRSFPFLSEWYNIFHTVGGTASQKKILPSNPSVLYNLLTYEALAH